MRDKKSAGGGRGHGADGHAVPPPRRRRRRGRRQRPRAAGGGAVDLLAAYLSNTCDRNQIENLLYQKLLPTDGAQRLRAITDVHAVLKGKERDVLKSMLRNKRKAQIQLALARAPAEAQGVEGRRPGQEGAGRPRQANDRRVVRPAARQEVWESLATSKDGNLRRALAVVASPTSSTTSSPPRSRTRARAIAQRLNHQAALPAVSNPRRSAMVAVEGRRAHPVEDVAAELDAMPGDGADAEP